MENNRNSKQTQVKRLRHDTKTLGEGALVETGVILAPL